MSALPEAYLKLVLPLIDKARELLEAGEPLQPFAFVGSHASGAMLPGADRQTGRIQGSVSAAHQTRRRADPADFVFTLLWKPGACPATRCPATSRFLLRQVRFGRRKPLQDRHLRAFVVETATACGVPNHAQAQGTLEKEAHFRPGWSCSSWMGWRGGLSGLATGIGKTEPALRPNLPSPWLALEASSRSLTNSLYRVLQRV